MHSYPQTSCEVNHTKKQETCSSHINLLVTLDCNYLSPLATMLESYLKVHGGIATDLYVAHSALTEENFKYLEQSVAGSNIQIHNIKITERYFKDTPILERLPEESFYRLLAFLYLPDSVEKCLYLDPDIYILKSLLPLYNTDMGNAYVAAAGHMHGMANVINKARLGCTEQKRYFNSGVMLMNLSAIRQSFTLDSVLECLENNAQRLILGDQDMANILFGKKTIFIDECIYNLDERTFRHYNKKKLLDLETVKQKTAIVHYNGKFKPWNDGYEGVLNCFYPKVESLGNAPTGILKKQVKSIYRITHPTKRQTIAITGTLLFFIACIFSYVFFGKELMKIISEPAVFREWLNRFGAFDELVFILVRAAQTEVKFIPAEPLEIGSGYAWGAIPGMIYCLIGNMIGTVVIFGLTKHFGQKIIKLFLPTKNMKSVKLFQSSERIYALLFFLYLIPGSPKDGFTYFVGLLPVKFIPFMIVTFIARIPSVLLSTICGNTLADKQYFTSVVIFVITIVMAAIGAVIYRRYTKSREKDIEIVK